MATSTNQFRSSSKESVDAYGITTVTLDNYSKNATIDYLRKEHKIRRADGTVNHNLPVLL